MQRAFLFSPVLMALLAGSFSPAQASGPARLSAPSDTIVVRLPNKATLTLTVRNTAQLRELKTYHLDSLTSRLATYITQAEKAAQASSTDQVTLQFFPDKDQPGKNLPEQVRITTRKKLPDASRVDVVLNKAFGLEVTTDDNGEKSYHTDPKAREARKTHRDSVRVKEQNSRRHSLDIVFDLGLNAFVNQKPYFTVGGQPEPVELRAEGSRYVNMGLVQNFRLGGKRSPLRLTVGPEFAYNNYMLNGNRRWVNENGRTDVILNRENRQYEKSKLATTSANLPLMLHLKLHDSHGHSTFTLAGGGFVGYQLKSWSKVKYTADGNTTKDKVRDSFNLEPLQYGLQGLIGYRGLKLFAKYNMNNLFKTGLGPDTQVLSFGLRIIGD